MNASTHGRQHHGGQGEEKRLGRQENNPRRGPDWRHVHHHWYFWVGVLLMLVAIGTYVMTEDLSWRPRARRTDTPDTAVLELGYPMRIGAA